jgi:hypothetical protein
MIVSSTWQPGFRLPLHMHPNGHEFTYAIEGEQMFEIEGVGTKVVKAGEVIYTLIILRTLGATRPIRFQDLGRSHQRQKTNQSWSRLSGSFLKW